MIASMTGYASLEGSAGEVGWSWELRGVNGRGLDLRLRLPDGLGALEQPLRQKLSAALSRGNVSLNLRLTRTGGAAGATLDRAALAAVLAALAEVQTAADNAGFAITAPSGAQILGLRGVMDGGEGQALPEPDILLQDSDALIAAFVAMRQAEGAALAAVMEAQLARIADLTEAARTAAAARTVTQAETFRANVARVLEATDAVDGARLAQELAMLAVKADVTEEIDRLLTHVTAARALMKGGGPVGRKLDFLMQEFNREANTLCSKSLDAYLTAIGLDLKLTIDQMREQVQNVE